jgi:dienelactone hydrolase
MTSYSEFAFESNGMTKRVFTKGTGPGILLMHELPGMVEQCIDLADEIARRGFTVFLPLLFGEPNVRSSRLRSATYAAYVTLCMRREIFLLASDEDSPLTVWLRALARDVRRRCPQGRGIGVIGMCLTGGFVINLMLEDVVLAPVACQPSLPLAPFGAKRRALGVSPDTLRAARDRSAQVPLLCYRFERDTLSTPERFARLQEEFGSAFEGHTLPGRGHSTITIDYVDEPGHPTHTARQRIFAFFQQRLS